MKFLLLISLILAIEASLAKPSREKVQVISPLYSRVFPDLSDQGNSTELDKFIPDLSALGIDNDIESVFQTGLWIYYDHKDYNSEAPGKVFYVHGIEHQYNFPENYRNMASSARFAGPRDEYNGDSITLYQGMFFTGREIMCLGNKTELGTNLDKQASSAVVTGISPWTLYTEKDYKGTSYCVYPNTDKDIGNNGEILLFGIFADINQAGVPDNSIRSVRKGCSKKSESYLLQY